ncbi:MAG: trypsin-like peptidase domain-containing protein [Pyrinomonadaceae bacterium]
MPDGSRLTQYGHTGRIFALIAFLSFFFIVGELAAQTDKLPPATFAGIAKKVEPAVVTINTKTAVPQAAVSRDATPPSDNSDLMEFLRRQMQPRAVAGVGSGFLVDKAGYVVTNAHVIDGATRITVKLESGEEFTAKLVGSDELTDLAVLKIEARRDLPFLKFADSDKAEVGDWVLAVGSPFNLNKTVTAGIISQTRRETPYATAFQRFIQTDAAINRGNSGGPLVNLSGEVVGVNSQIATSTGDYNGVGFALPARDAEYVYNQIVRNGKVRRGYLGVMLDSVKSEYAAVYGLKDGRGAIVTDIPNRLGPAAVAGVQVGDIVTEFNGKPILNAQDLIERVGASSPEESVTLSLLREVGTTLESKTAVLKVGERPARRSGMDNGERRTLPVDGAKADQKPFGLTLVELTPAVAATYKLDGRKGLMIKEINPSSLIADIKTATGDEALSEGDVIQRINRVSVADLPAFNSIVAKLKVGDPVVLHVLSQGAIDRSRQLKIVQFTVR